jgi:hypothetical protein
MTIQRISQLHDIEGRKTRRPRRSDTRLPQFYGRFSANPAVSTTVIPDDFFWHLETYPQSLKSKERSIYREISKPF